MPDGNEDKALIKASVRMMCPCTGRTIHWFHHHTLSQVHQKWRNEEVEKKKKNKEQEDDEKQEQPVVQPKYKRKTNNYKQLKEKNPDRYEEYKKRNREYQQAKRDAKRKLIEEQQQGAAQQQHPIVVQQTDVVQTKDKQKTESTNHPVTVCIPSYKRSRLCNNKTLAMLHKEGIPKEQIYVYVANMEEKQEYEKVLDKTRYGHLVTGLTGIVQQRDFICRQWPAGTHLVLLDDDVSCVDLSLTPFADLAAFFHAAFDQCVQAGAHMWGVYPVWNPYFRKSRPEISHNLAYIIAAFHGIINRPQLEQIQLKTSLNNPYKEDVERTILYYKHDGAVVRFNRIGFRTRYYGTTGGLGTFEDRKEPSLDAVRMLFQEYPDCGRVVERKNGMAEFKLFPL